MSRLTCLLSLPILLMACQSYGQAASWNQLANTPRSNAGTMILLTDGTVMVEESDRIHWMRLTPDAKGSYINGDWTTTPSSQMGTQRLYFASQVLQSGKVWVLGGEYTGIGIPKNWAATGELFDPVSNTWSAISPFPDQSGCPVETEFGGALTVGSPVANNLVSTYHWQPGWSVSGAGIPTATVITSVDSPTQIHLSTNSTLSAGVALTIGFQAKGNTTAGSDVITGIASTGGYTPHSPISGAGIPANTSIASVDSATQITISRKANATAAGVALAFTFAIVPLACVGDDPSILLPGGQILVGDLNNAGTHLYDIATNAWTPGPSKFYPGSSDEQGWAKLADGSVITYDIGQSENTDAGYAERYDPAAGRWSGISPSDGTANGVLPVLTSTALGNELGPLLRLYDNRMFVIGANGHTALYTPSTTTWSAGPDIVGSLGGLPFTFGADDAPAAILPNGHVILAADAASGVSSIGTTISGSPIITGIPSTAALQLQWKVSGAGIPSGAIIKSKDSATQVTISENATASGSGVPLIFGVLFAPPTQLFDFDPSANLIMPVSPTIPDGNLSLTSSFSTRMLMLPTGQLLFSDGSNVLWVYTPDGTADPTLQPVITSVLSSGSGLFTLNGTQLTGQSAGSSYGDDVQNDETYPIVSLTNASGGVYYARTTNWSYIGIAGGSMPQTVYFTLNPRMPAGVYSLRVSAAGISSNPLQVTVSADLTRISVTPLISSAQDAESARTSIVSGQWTAIYGQGLSYTTRKWDDNDFSTGVATGSPLPTTLDGVSVTIGGQPAAVYFVSPTQIDVQAPSNLPLGDASVVVINNGAVSSSFTATIVQSSPSFFSYPAGTNLFAAAVHLSGELVGDPAISGSSVAPAQPGEVLMLYANGLAPSTGGIILAPTTFLAPITITAGNYPLTVLGSELVSAGQFQINVQLPSNIPPGNYPLTMIVPNGSTVASGITVTMPVGP